MEGVEPCLSAREDLMEDMIDPFRPLQQAKREFDLFVRRDFGVSEHLDRKVLEMESHPGAVK
jgi:hypothetical protein